MGQLLSVVVLAIGGAAATFIEIVGINLNNEADDGGVGNGSENANSDVARRVVMNGVHSKSRERERERERETRSTP